MTVPMAPSGGPPRGAEPAPPRWPGGDTSLFTVLLDGDMDVPRLREALVQAMDGLRGRVRGEGGPPGEPVHVTDLRHLSGGREAAVRRAAARFIPALTEADDRGDSARAALFQLGDRQWMLLVTAGPALINAASWGPFAEDLSSAYAGQRLARAYAGRRPARGPCGPVAAPAGSGYWRSALADARQAMTLPADRGHVRHGGHTAAVPVASSAGQQRAVRELAAAAGVTPGSVLVAAFGVVLARYAGESPIVLGWSACGPPWLLPLCLRVGAHQPFTQLCAETEATMTACLAHAWDSELGGELAPMLAADPDDPPFPVGVSVGPAAWRRLRLPGVTVAEFTGLTEPSHRLLELRIGTEAPGLTAALRYSTETFDQPTAMRIAGHVQTLLSSALARPGGPAARLAMLPRAERDAVLLTGNATVAPGPDGKFLPDLFEEQVRMRPQGCAVISDGRRISYAELDNRANRLAHRLRELGVGHEDPVGVLAGRDTGAVTAFLGVLKAAASYVPLDDQYPTERLTFIARHAGLRALITTREHGVRFGLPPGVPVISLGDGGDDQVTASPPARAGTPESLAYLIYTSGSTGQPKGVSLTHGGAVNLAAELHRRFALSGADTVALFASLGFDASVWEMIMALTSGAALLMVDPRGRTPAETAALMTEAGVTCATLPPAFLNMLTGRELPTVRLLVSAGEACTPTLCRTWSPGRTLVNAYGPTETTVCATAAECTGREPVVPIGLPLAGLRAYVLDDRLEPVPLGIAGQLYLGGAGLARGYWRDPARTAAAFVPDPFGPPGSRLYRTGDVVRRLPDGQLTYLGRVDGQVKIRGHRVETAEVEAVIARHPDVREVAVVAEREAGPDDHLVAYVVLAGQAQNVAGRGTGQLRWQGHSLQRELHGFAAGVLPGYMLPGRYVSLPAFPLTPHGKIDLDELRRAAPVPDGLEQAEPEALTGTEQVVAAIWGKHLGLDDVRRDDHFLEIGGHSLVAVEVIGELRQHFGIELPIRVLFDYPVLAELAQAVDELRGPGGAAGSAVS